MPPPFEGDLLRHVKVTLEGHVLSDRERAGMAKVWQCPSNPMTWSASNRRFTCSVTCRRLHPMLAGDEAGAVRLDAFFMAGARKLSRS